MDGYAVAFPLISKTASLWPGTMVSKKCGCHIFIWTKNVTVASDITFLTFKVDCHNHDNSCDIPQKPVIVIH